MDEPAQERIDLRDYLRVFLKRRWTVLAVFAVTVLTVTIHAFTATPVYKATTRLIIDKENPNVVSIQEVMAVDASGTDYYQTQYKIIESRSVAREVVRRLNLHDSEEFSPKPKDTLLSNVKAFVVDTVSSAADAVASLFRREKAPGEPSEQEEADNRLISTFLEKIDVSPIRTRRLVDVSFEAKDPVLSAKIVNTLTAAYIDQNLETKLKAVQDAVRWLQTRIEEERKKVERPPRSWPSSTPRWWKPNRGGWKRKPVTSRPRPCPVLRRCWTLFPKC